jgi:hypothetical protein
MYLNMTTFEFIVRAISLSTSLLALYYVYSDRCKRKRLEQIAKRLEESDAR